MKRLSAAYLVFTCIRLSVVAGVAWLAIRFLGPQLDRVATTVMQALRSG